MWQYDNIRKTKKKVEALEFAVLFLLKLQLDKEPFQEFMKLYEKFEEKDMDSKHIYMSKKGDK